MPTNFGGTSYNMGNFYPPHFLLLSTVCVKREYFAISFFLLNRQQHNTVKNVDNQMLDLVVAILAFDVSVENEVQPFVPIDSYHATLFISVRSFL